MGEGDRVVVSMTPEQADAVERALDLYSRLLMGQVGDVALLAREGYLSVRVPDGRPRHPTGLDESERIEEAMRGVRAVLGDYHGIGHRHVHVNGKRAYEVQKAIGRVLAYRHNPDPGMATTRHDGLTVRYTADPAPTAELVPGA